MRDTINTASEPLLKPGELAAALSVTTPTVLQWYRDGIIPAKIAVGRIYRFDFAEVEEALAARSKPQAEAADERDAE